MKPILIAALLAYAPARAADFDGYLLSLSLAPSFCALSRANAGHRECQTLTESAFQATPLTIHGLWPQRAGVSVNRQPHDCDGPPLDTLSPGLRQSLARYMPAGPGLAAYEWRKHGVCSGLDAETYFAAEIRLATMADTMLGPTIAAAAGKRLAIADLLAASRGLGPSVIVDCQTPRGGGDPVIAEIRITLSTDLAPIPAATLGMGQNSGCHAGAGLVPMVGG